MRVRSLVVLVLVVFAGCSGVFGGSDEPTKTLTPAAVPTDQPTPAAPRYPPGLSSEGVENAYAFLDAHVSTLRNQSFIRRSNTTWRRSNGSVVVHTTSTRQVGPVGDGIHTVATENVSNGFLDIATVSVIPVRTETWWRGGDVFRRATYANGTTTTDRQRSTANRRLGIVSVGLRPRLGALSVDTTSVTERVHNGTTWFLVRSEVPGDLGRGNTSLELLVDSGGVVHQLRRVSSLPSENVSRIVSVTRFSGIGTTDPPERPSWVDAASNRTTPVPDPAAPTAHVATVTTKNPIRTTNRTAAANAPTATGSP